jgi:hypothetical protein
VSRVELRQSSVSDFQLVFRVITQDYKPFAVSHPRSYSTFGRYSPPAFFLVRAFLTCEHVLLSKRASSALSWPSRCLQTGKTKICSHCWPAASMIQSTAVSDFGPVGQNQI